MSRKKVFILSESEYLSRIPFVWQGNRAIKASSSVGESETNSRRTARSERIKIFFGTQTGKAKVLLVNCMLFFSVCTCLSAVI